MASKTLSFKDGSVYYGNALMGERIDGRFVPNTDLMNRSVSFQKRVQSFAMPKKSKRMKIGKVSPGSRFSKVDVLLPSGGDADINLVLPNGQKIIVQYRIESPSIDVCMPFNTSVVNWKGVDMQSAPSVHRQAHVRLVGQMVIELPEAVLEDGGDKVPGSFPPF